MLNLTRYVGEYHEATLILMQDGVILGEIIVLQADSNGHGGARVRLGLNLPSHIRIVRADAQHRPEGPSDAWMAMRAETFAANPPTPPITPPPAQVRPYYVAPGAPTAPFAAVGPYVAAAVGTADSDEADDEAESDDDVGDDGYTDDDGASGVDDEYIPYDDVTRQSWSAGGWSDEPTYHRAPPPTPARAASPLYTAPRAITNDYTDRQPRQQGRA